jgi:hypothetical protein
MTSTSLKRLTGLLAFFLVVLLAGAAPAFAGTDAKPAGGAAIGQIIIANLMAGGASAVLLWLAMGHRSGKVPYLGRAAAFTERVSGLPGWAALPSVVSTASLMVALLGMYWDISLHIDVGRDPGPLANPAHYLILSGLFGIFAAGFIALALPKSREEIGPTAVRLTRAWYAPLGGVLITLCAFFSLLAFPLDDMWHRLFGQDVTLWGPTHLMLFGGASLTLLGQAVLLVEGLRARNRGGAPRENNWIVGLRRVAVMGGLLIGLSTFQGEFDFGVPQFQMIFQPMLIALAAGVGLVCARLWIGRGGALGAVVFFLGVRGAISLIVGDVFGQTMPALALYLVEGLCVELAGLWLAERPFALGAVSGVLIGTVGFAAEYGWTHVVYTLPWNTALLPAGPIMATIAGVAGAMLGALIALALRGELPRPVVARSVLVASLVAIMGLTANGLVTTVPSGWGATVSLKNIKGPPDREAQATIRLHPSNLADGARWLSVTDWQGGGLTVDRPKQIAPGVYRTTEPISVNGNWKATLRIQKGRSVMGLPIYMPRDPAIPVGGVPATSRFDRPFVKDKQLLQREQKKGVPSWLTTLAPLVVLAIAIALITALSLGLGMLGRSKGGTPSPQPRRRRGWRDRLVPDMPRVGGAA